MAPRNTTKEVFKIEELLANIIFYLPVRRILTTASRVSHKWSDTVWETPEIRRKLFLSTAITPSPVSPTHFKKYNYRDDCSPVYAQTLNINPLVQDVKRTRDFPELTRSSKAGEAIEVAFVVQLGRIHYVSQQESWRGMFLTDPPCTTLYVEGVLTGAGRGGSVNRPAPMHTSLVVREKTGITWGLLEETLADLCRQQLEEDLSSCASFHGRVHDALSG